MAEEPGRVFSRYLIGRLLGEGGMGQVYEAEDTVLHRRVALKFLREPSPEFRKRFLHEAQMQAGLDHENICKVYDVGERDGQAYIAMQFLTGETLNKTAPFMTLEQKVKVLMEVAEAVQAAHRLGLIHRDLKPENVMIETREGEPLRPYVMDFGLARELSGEKGLTMTGMIVGTPSYMSPEQVRGDITQLDRRTDVYSLGVTLYEVLTGRTPFDGKSTVDVMMAILQKDPVPLRQVDRTLPEDLETVVMKCLEREKHRRYDSARALAEDLRRFLDGDPVEAKRASWGYRLRKRAVKNWRLVTLSAVALVAVVAFATAFVVERVRSAANAELAQRFGQELRDMEWSMRLAYALPLHDIREERARVKERIGSIESLMKKRGRSGEAAGHGALGRGNLVLREYEKARQHLQRAFEVDRTPALALALGEAYAGLYTTATNAADRIPSKALREEKKKAIDRELGARALDFLNKGREAALESPALVEGRMLYLKHEWDRALELSEKAHAAAPMRAEAKLLEGRIRSARATEKRAAGDLDRAAREYLMANAAFEAAAELSRSDPEVHEAACALGRHFVMLAVQQGQPPDSAYARAVVACDRATSVDPDSSPAYQEKVWIYWQVADYAKEHGGDWKKLVESAVNAGLEAVRAGPRDAGAHGMLGLAYSTDAEFSASEGRDPKGALEKAIASLKRALEIDSHHVTALNELGNVLSVKAENEDDSGLDPRGSYRESIRMFERILEFKPDSASALNNLGTNMHLLSRADFDRGLDPRPGCQKALAAIAGALKVNPRMFAAMTNRSLVHTLLADEALSRGEDPGKHLRSALEDLDAALRVAPNDPIAAELAGRVLLRQTEYEIETAADEQASLREAKARLAKAQELNPSSVAVLRYIGGLAALQADGLRRRGQNPEAALAEGRAAFAKAFAIQRSTTSLIGVGNLELVAVRWAVDHRQSPEAAWERGRKALDEALSRNPSRIDAAVLLGRLCRFSAEFGLSQRPPWSRTTEMLAKGRECAAKALAINPSSPEIRALDAAIAILQAQANRGEGTPNLEEPKARLRTALLENRLLENEYGALAGTRAGK